MESGLPPSLLRYLADSDMDVLSWDGAARELAVRITKEIGPEVGTLRFSEVTHVNLPARVSISRIECGGLKDLPASYLSRYRPGDQALTSDEKVFLVHGSWSEEYFVIAQKVEYEVHP